MRRVMNQRGVAEFAILTVISVFLWILTIGVVKNVKKEQPTVQVQQQDQVTQQIK